MAHEVYAGPGFRLMSFVLWLKIEVKLRVQFGELLTVDSPLLVRMSKGKLVPMTGAFMAQMDKTYRHWAGSKLRYTVEGEVLQLRW